MENQSELWEHCSSSTISFPWVPPRVHHECSRMLQLGLTEAKKRSIPLLSPYKVNSFRNPFFQPSI